MTPSAITDPTREPISRWWLLWKMNGLPRCSQASYPESAPHCWRLIWPWQGRLIRNGAPVHVQCLLDAEADNARWGDVA